MRRFSALVALATCCIFSGVALPAVARAAANIDVVDDSGHHVQLATAARRIISLAPHTTELIGAAGALDELVAVSAFSDYPPSVTHLPVVGSAFGVDLEALARLHPDLVVAWTSGNSAAQLEALEALGIPVFRSDPTSLEAIATNVERLGQLSGHASQAAESARRLRAAVAELQSQYGSRPPVRVFYQVWASPLMTVGGTQIISDVIRLCGGRNIFADLKSPAPTVEREAVIGADPEVIVAVADGEDPDALAAWLAWPQVAAVHNHRLVTLPADEITRATPRVVLGAQNCALRLTQRAISAGDPAQPDDLALRNPLDQRLPLREVLLDA